MNFGEAIEALKQGKKVQRSGWNGKNMWIVLMPGLQLTAKHIGSNTPLDSCPYLAMWTAQQQWQPGWLASQADMLADDWQLV